MGASGNREILLSAMGRFAAGDLNGYMELYDAAVLLHGYTPEPLDYAGARSFYEGIFAAFSDLGLVSQDEVEGEDKVVTRFTMSGRHTGDFMGIAPTGREFSADGITILRFAGGKCVERWSSYDFLGLLSQLGVAQLP